MTQEKLEQLEAEIESLFAEKKSLGAKITRAVKKRDQLFITLNEENMKDMKWLIQNPTAPGHYEAIGLKMFELYDGDYNGVHVEGYTVDDKYNPIQTNFSFWFEVYSEEKRTEKKALYLKNCKHFIDNYIQYMVPTDDIESRYDKKFPRVKVISFKFSSEESGIQTLGYEPVEGVWYHYELVYGRTNVFKKYETFEEAFEWAFNYVNKERCDSGI